MDVPLHLDIGPEIAVLPMERAVEWHRHMLVEPRLGHVEPLLAAGRDDHDDVACVVVALNEVDSLLVRRDISRSSVEGVEVLRLLRDVVPDTAHVGKRAVYVNDNCLRPGH